MDCVYDFWHDHSPGTDVHNEIYYRYSTQGISSAPSPYDERGISSAFPLPPHTHKHISVLNDERPLCAAEEDMSFDILLDDIKF